VLKVVKIPMKKFYYYLYSSEDPDADPDLRGSLASGRDDTFSDVYSYLDKQSFDVSKSVIRNIIEFAARQSRDL
jgi:hypothetical protein